MTSRLLLRLERRKANSPVVCRPTTVNVQRRPGGILDVGNHLLTLGKRKWRQVVPPEHTEPPPHSLLRRRRAVSASRSERSAQATEVAAWVQERERTRPGAGSTYRACILRCRLALSESRAWPTAVMIARMLFCATELRHESPAGLQSVPNGLDDRLRWANPMEHGVGEDGVELAVVRAASGRRRPRSGCGSSFARRP